MSEDTNPSPSSCASCGIGEVDDIKLKECDDCDLVKYCSDTCQKEHKTQHEEACKKRAAELRNELLFKQPERNHLGDCPICYLPLPLDITKSSMTTCCSKIICCGCYVANLVREAKASLGNASCPFCRKLFPLTEEESDKQNMERVEMNDPVAICHKGAQQMEEGNYTSAFEYWSKAAELGDFEAHFKLAAMYHYGRGVEKDEGNEIHHLEEAAIHGVASARHRLGWYEMSNENSVRAAKHWIIAATQGCDDSMNSMMDMFKGGFVSKEVLAATLRAHQAAADATKSPQRKAAEEYYRRLAVKKRSCNYDEVADWFGHHFPILE